MGPYLPAELAGRLELDLQPDGRPANPLVVLELDEWRDAPADLIRRAAGLVADALPVTAGLLTGPPTPRLQPLIAAASLTLTTGKPTGGTAPDGGALEIVQAEDIPGAPDLEGALGRLRAAVERSPRAAVACGQLLRQTAALDTAGGLAAEAATYSLLLGGPEFGRWLGERGAPRHREPPGQPVLASRDGGRLSIVLNDPARRNAFSSRLREALLDVLLVGEADETIESVELSGAGESFCSGGDLDEFGTADDLVAAYLVRLSRAPWRVIDRIAARVTVTIQGACIGAGAEMTAYAGRVIAAADAFFALPEVSMGLVPGAGGSVSVPRRIGRWRAAWLMLTGDRIPAATALRWGLVDEIRPLAYGDHGHRELPVGVLLVTGGVRPVGAPHAVQLFPVRVLSSPDHPVIGLHRVRAEFDGDGAVDRLQVGHPQRVLRRPSSAAADNVGVAVGRRDEWVDVLPAGLAAAGVQKERRLALPVSAKHACVGPEVLDRRVVERCHASDVSARQAPASGQGRRSRVRFVSIDSRPDVVAAGYFCE
jgi:enoyl-CoA hydratase/carnithine racemase